MEGVVEVRGGRVRGVQREEALVVLGRSLRRRSRTRAAAGGRPARWPDGKESGCVTGSGRSPPRCPGWSNCRWEVSPDEQAEDCLTLNVWTPEPDGGQRPVMVWVHGGSFVSGSGAGSLYRGGMLSREGDVVVVTLNYRLGLLGFLAHPALRTPGQAWLDGEEWSGFGNWGLADQVAALRWVQDHIAEFGGDPGNVTLFGESAGGMSVSSLLGHPGGAGTLPPGDRAERTSLYVHGGAGLGPGRTGGGSSGGAADQGCDRAGAGR